MATLSSKDWTIQARGDSKLYMSDVRAVHPITPGGLFDGIPGLTNLDAHWMVTDDSGLLGGSLEIFDGGAYTYTPGTGGIPTFDFTAYDYDGAGNKTTIQEVLPANTFNTVTDQELRDAGFALAKDYGVDSANTDNATQLQNWADGAKDADKIGYIHYSPDPYLTSNRIAITHRVDYRNPNGPPPYEHWGFVGGRNPANPTDRTDRLVIKLKDNSPGYDNIGTPKPLVFFCTVQPDGTSPGDPDTWPPYVAPDNPIYMPSGWKDGNGNAYGMYMEGVDLDLGSGNPGAGGLLMPGAQRCALSDVHIEATGARYGFMCVNGTNNPSQNLSCNGAYIGYQNSYDNLIGNGSGENAINLKLTNCTIPINYTSTACATCITGLEISGSTSAGNFDVDLSAESMNITDARIEITGGGRAFDNVNGGNLRLMNVYVTGTNDLVQSGSQPAVIGSGTWKRIKYYVSQCQNKNTGGSGYNDATTGSYVDGSAWDESQEPVSVVENDVADPGSPIRTRHGMPIYRLDDGSPYIDVVNDYGAVADGSDAGLGTDNRAAIQAAIDAAETAGHNRVFIPAGIFAVGKSPAGDYGLLLRPETKLFGIWSGRIGFTGINSIGSMLLQHSSWFPTSPSPVIQTTNTTSGDWAFCNIDVMTLQRTDGVTSRSTPPTYEWSTCMQVRSKGSTWGQHSGIGPYIDWNFFLGIPQPDSAQPRSNARNMWHFTDNAEGKFYCPGLNNPPGWNDEDFRGIKTEGTTRPIIFYGQNFEIAKGASVTFGEIRYKCEFVNSSNVIVINHKHEGRAGAARWENCTNCAYIGDGAHYKDNLDFIYIFDVQGACSDMWLGGTQHRSVAPSETLPTLLRANVTGQTAISRTYNPYDLGVYKLGDFDVENFFNSIAGPLAVDPIAPDGFLANDSYITLPATATYIIISSNLPKGSITWKAGGSFDYDFIGVTPGAYQFTYQVLNIDGQGTDGAVITVTVNVT